MTPTARKIHRYRSLLPALALAALVACASAPAPVAELAGAEAAVLSAERAGADDLLAEARAQLLAARNAMAASEYAEARLAAELAQVYAEQATAEANVARARQDAMEKGRRNADLRRRLQQMEE